MNNSPNQVHSPFTRLLARRHGGIVLFYAVFLAIAFATRVLLLVKAAHDVTWTLSLVAAFFWGAIFDLGAAAFASLPLILLLTLLPARALFRIWARWPMLLLGFAILFALLFGAAAEWTFWDEFGVRFNFIAVDYLVYTTEVLGNIRESYPLPLIVGGLLVASAGIAWWIWKLRWIQIWLEASEEKAGARWRHGAAWFAAALAFGCGLDSNWLPGFRNNFNREIGKDGLWSLFAAFRHNVLDYDEFYLTRPEPEVFGRLREKLVEDGSRLLRPADDDTLRYVKNTGPELRPNVIQITVESLSASFLSIFNRASGLSPNLADLARESLVFENFYATGTRTDRGMEALTLSLPPTPGRSMIKRERNADLFTLGAIFRAKGYDTAFIYGGFGYFDNMNTFFGGNGYRVVDRSSVKSGDITFANVWGACDEDLYRWTMREADAQFAAGKPFHFFVMTTSNHRPYTFPEGKIDLPSKISGRAGAVKYTDFAIGQFLRDAAKKPWYRNTVFVVVADHCASSAGRTELPVDNYHIPLMIFAPGGQIPKGSEKMLMSQMDYAPTLLGLLHWSYPSRFFGHDIRRIGADQAHALIGNYQKLGYLNQGSLVVLRPQRGEMTYKVELGSSNLVPAPGRPDETTTAISYYQAASYLYKHDQYRVLSADEYARYSASGERMGEAKSQDPGRK